MVTQSMDPLDEVIAQQLGGGTTKTITVVHEDGSRWLHDAATGDPIRQMSGPTQTAQTNYGYVTRPQAGSSGVGPFQRTQQVPIVETKTVNGVLYGRPEGSAQFQPIQDFNPPTGTETTIRGNTVYRQNADGTLTPIQELPSTATAPQRAPRYPEEEQLARLQVQKAQQDLMSPYALAQQQTQEAITAIQQQLANGDITVEEANRLMALTRSNLEAAMQGTTPFQMDQARQQAERLERQQRENLAAQTLDRTVSSGTSMANALLSGASGIYGNMLNVGAPLNFDPLAMAKGFVTDLGGGPQMSEMAQAILRGALSPGGQQ
jgi:hypothetical protein